MYTLAAVEESRKRGLGTFGHRRCKNGVQHARGEKNGRCVYTRYLLVRMEKSGVDVSVTYGVRMVYYTHKGPHRLCNRILKLREWTMEHTRYVALRVAKREVESFGH